ncbi:hypothetical protein V6N13_074298 [Hibiscus sabdariffa]|uniref:Uncharacterized protein n=1 Tax=Hibiscus sabdariffa TaxID=183260 RepID=A0ABR2U865_9ROSI
MQLDISLLAPPRRSSLALNRWLIEDGGMGSQSPTADHADSRLEEKNLPHNCATLLGKYSTSNKTIDSLEGKSNEKNQSDLSMIPTQFLIIDATVNDSLGLLTQ